MRDYYLSFIESFRMALSGLSRMCANLLSAISSSEVSCLDNTFEPAAEEFAKLDIVPNGY